MKCILVLGVSVGGLKLYHHVPRRALPAHFFRYFYCSMCRLTSVTVECIVQPQHSEKWNWQNFCIWSSREQHGKVTITITDAVFSVVQFAAMPYVIHCTISFLIDSYDSCLIWRESNNFTNNFGFSVKCIVVGCLLISGLLSLHAYVCLLCSVSTEAILRPTGATQDEDLTTNHGVTHSGVSHSSSMSNVIPPKRLAPSSRELGILGLPPEKMTLVREKKDDIEKVMQAISQFILAWLFSG